MHSELDRFTYVLRTYGVNRAAVKHALRMREQLRSSGDIDGATEWHAFALAILRRLRKTTRRTPEKTTLH